MEIASYVSNRVLHTLPGLHACNVFKLDGKSWNYLVVSMRIAVLGVLPFSMSVYVAAIFDLGCLSLLLSAISELPLARAPIKFLSEIFSRVGTGAKVTEWR